MKSGSKGVMKRPYSAHLFVYFTVSKKVQLLPYVQESPLRTVDVCLTCGPRTTG